MPTPAQGSTRDQLIAAAAQLFSERGVKATSTGEIQRAVGLAPGSGALYKHFSSKDELLEAVVSAYLDRLDAETDEVLDVLPNDLESALPLVAAAVGESMRRERNTLRLVLRDLEHRPDLVERVWHSVLVAVPGRFATWVQRAKSAGTVRPGSTDQAVVLMAALMEAHTVRALVDQDFASVLNGTFEEAWVATAARALAP